MSWLEIASKQVEDVNPETQPEIIKKENDIISIDPDFDESFNDLFDSLTDIIDNYQHLYPWICQRIHTHDIYNIILDYIDLEEYSNVNSDTESISSEN